MPRPTSRHDNGMSARYSRSRRRDRRTALRTTMARAIWEVGRNWSSQGSRIPAISMSHTDKMARIPALPQARVAHNPSGADGAVTDRSDASAAEVRYASGTLMSDMGVFSEFEWVWPARTLRTVPWRACYTERPEMDVMAITRRPLPARGPLRISRRGFLCRPASGVCLRQGRYYRRAAAVAGYQLRARKELTKRL